MTSKWRPLKGSAQSVALEVLVAGPLSRSELASRVKLSPASLTRLTAPLVQSGLLVEVERPSDTVRLGRPSRPLDIVPTSHHFIGVKLTRDDVTAVVTTLRAEPLATEREPLPDQSAETVVKVIVDLVGRLAERVPSVDGIGIGVGGAAPDGSVVIESVFTEWASVPLGSMVEQGTGTPVVVVNDVVALMEAERWFGAPGGMRTFALLTIGAGIGYGLAIHGNLITNDETGIGRIGHHLVSPGGPACPQGHLGCATAMLTTEGIQSRASSRLGRFVDHQQVLGLAKAGDPIARSTVDESGLALGRLVGAIATFTMTRTVVISGEGAAIADVARGAIDEGIATTMDPESSPVSILVRPSDFTEWARGAAVVAIQRFVTLCDDGSGLSATERRGVGSQPGVQSGA